MALCNDCKIITTVTGTICSHCELEYCPSCLDMHWLELRDEQEKSEPGQPDPAEAGRGQSRPRQYAWRQFEQR